MKWESRCGRERRPRERVGRRRASPARPPQHMTAFLFVFNPKYPWMVLKSFKPSSELIRLAFLKAHCRKGLEAHSGSLAPPQFFTYIIYCVCLYLGLPILDGQVGGFLFHSDSDKEIRGVWALEWQGLREKPSSPYTESCICWPLIRLRKARWARHFLGSRNSRDWGEWYLSQ